MNKYAQAALAAVQLFQQRKATTPNDAWEQATIAIFGAGTSSQKKRCPKNAFLGLCQAGFVKGIPSGSYTRSEKNKLYALAAVKLLQQQPNLANHPDQLWELVIPEPKVHNHQMDVAVALWQGGLISTPR